MITLKEYFMGRDEKHPEELTAEVLNNSRETVDRVNSLLELFGSGRIVVSGWRPQAINNLIKNAKPKSNHITGKACDLEDLDGSLDAWCMLNLTTLSKIGLWLEHPNVTHGWCHVQTVPPKSQSRVFFP